MRIISLVPSLTELVCELGLTDYLVGRTGYCLHPRELVATVPKVGGTKNINLKKIRQLAPTHVILNKDENRWEDAKALEAFVPNIVVTHPLTAQDNLAVYQQFGEVFDCQARAQQMSEQLGNELELCRAHNWVPKNVLYLIWKNPWMTISPPTYIASMLREVGLKAVAPKPQDSNSEPPRYPQFESSDAVALATDAILFSSEPYQFSTDDFGDTAGWAPTGVPRRMIDGEMLSWYGPRAIAGLQYLRKFRHDLFEN